MKKIFLFLFCLQLGTVILAQTVITGNVGGLSSATNLTGIVPIVNGGTNSSIATGSGSVVLQISPIILPSTVTYTASATLALTDENKFVDINVASTNTVTIPPNSSVAFDIGATIIITQVGAGQTVFVAGSGVTINSDGAKLKIASQYSAAYLRKTATNTWSLIGNLTL